MTRLITGIENAVEALVGYSGQFVYSLRCAAVPIYKAVPFVYKMIESRVAISIYAFTGQRIPFYHGGFIDVRHLEGE